jgi:ADP-ribose pyrophosphatase YjhB (NUDIX family)
MSEPQIRVGCAVLVTKFDTDSLKLLLGKRGKEPEYGKVIIPGGKVELFETHEAAAHREIREEAGIEIVLGRQFRTYSLIRPQQHRVITFYEADYKSGVLRPSSDLLEAKFCSRAEIRAMADRGELTDFTQMVLKDVQWYFEPTLPI